MDTVTNMDTTKVLSVFFIELLLILTFYYLNTEVQAIALAESTGLTNVLAVIFPIIWIMLIIGSSIAGLREATK